ncbi:hypothetical protein TREES_T100013151 [Tupaia chinensis]|uniref:Uncharacterized protein n=1 Tax=Tupaia chinensis TaxID=246437 RepID=L9KRN0_TUPCH|nr:hypothetical protein TREES_T100013151 [Tupaia chinensis]
MAKQPAAVSAERLQLPPAPLHQLGFRSGPYAEDSTGVTESPLNRK